MDGFPCKNAIKIYAYPMGIWPYDLYRKREIILFDPDTNKGIRGKKSYLKLFRSIGYYLKICRLLKKHYWRVKQEYIDQYKWLTSYECWKEYLKLDD